jgi:hypothetical protein
MIAMGGGVTTAMLASKLIERVGQHALSEVPEYKRKPGAFQKAKKEYGVDVGYAHGVGKDNAGFARKEELREAANAGEDYSEHYRKLLQKAKAQGLVITAKGYRRPGVVEHELGHAIAAKGSGLERFTQGAWAKGLSGLGSVGGLAAGVYAGAAHGPLAGALTGLGVAGLGNLPLISGEVLAHRYGKELLPKGREGINSAPFVGSYINSGITAPTVAGALMGLLGRKA